MQAGGLVGAIWSGLRWLGKTLSDFFGPALLDLWSAFVGFIDSIFTWLGFPNAFSRFIAWLVNMWDWLLDSIGYTVDLLISIFSFLTATMTKSVSLFSQIITYWIETIQGVISFLDSGMGAVGGVWDMLGMTWWLTLGCILYPIWLVYLWEEEGFDALINHLTFVYELVMGIVNFFIRIIQTVINVIGSLIESIPVVE